MPNLAGILPKQSWFGPKEALEIVVGGRKYLCGIGEPIRRRWRDCLQAFAILFAACAVGGPFDKVIAGVIFVVQPMIVVSAVSALSKREPACSNGENQ